MAEESSGTEAEPRPFDHLSYSSLSDWLQCGKAFQLKRLVGLAERPAMWNLGGHAVHAATEAYDRQMYAAVQA